jgi:hypothetical protein
VLLFQQWEIQQFALRKTKRSDGGSGGGGGQRKEDKETLAELQKSRKLGLTC